MFFSAWGWSISSCSPSKLSRSCSWSWSFLKTDVSSGRSEASSFNFSAIKSPLVRSSGYWWPLGSGWWKCWCCWGTGRALITELTRCCGAVACWKVFPNSRSKSDGRQSRFCNRRWRSKKSSFLGRQIPAAPSASACGAPRCVLRSHQWSPNLTLLILWDYFLYMSVFILCNHPHLFSTHLYQVRPTEHLKLGKPLGQCQQPCVLLRLWGYGDGNRWLSW